MLKKRYRIVVYSDYRATFEQTPDNECKIGKVSRYRRIIVIHELVVIHVVLLFFIKITFYLWNIINYTL